jgi:hypothetical protein
MPGGTATMLDKSRNENLQFFFILEEIFLKIHNDLFIKIKIN